MNLILYYHQSFFPLAISKSSIEKIKGWNAARAARVVDNLHLLISAAARSQPFF